MGRLKTDQSFFEENIPPASVDFEARTMGMLRTLAAMEAQTANEAPRLTPRRKLSTVAVLVLLLIALAATALAIGLNWSQRYQMGKVAKDAVMQKYGLSVETMALFGETPSQNGDTWTFTYRPILFSSNPIGEYTVVIQSGHEPVAAWSHDDAAKADGGFEARAWGQSQLESALDAHNATVRNNSAIDWENTDEMTLADWAEQDKALLEASKQGFEPFVMNVAPTENDISPEDAVKRAKEAVIAKFGVSEERLSKAKVAIRFFKYADDAEPKYRISLVNGKSETMADSEEFGIDIFSPSGKVEECAWAVAPEDRTLPAGSLVGMYDAVSAFIKEGAFGFLTPEEKAEAAARIGQAGYADILGHYEYVAPTDADLPEEKARALTAQAMKDKYNLTDETLELFRPGMSLQMENGRRVWVADYVPAVRDWEYGLPNGFFERLGSYRVAVLADTGATQLVDWSLQDFPENKAYSKETWGAAGACDARMLPLIKAFLLKQEPYMQETELSFEQLAARDQLFRDAGFPSEVYDNGVPKDGDITRENALALAYQALESEYGLSAEELRSWPVSTYFKVGDPAQRVWFFWIFPTGDRQGQDFEINVEAASGTILSITYSAGGNG